MAKTRLPHAYSGRAARAPGRVSPSKNVRRVEFGDFQTPPALASQLCSRLAATAVDPRSIVEPTCGTGNFLRAALRAFPTVTHVLAVDINPAYVAAVRRDLDGSRRLRTLTASFF